MGKAVKKLSELCTARLSQSLSVPLRKRLPEVRQIKGTAATAARDNNNDNNNNSFIVIYHMRTLRAHGAVQHHSTNYTKSVRNACD